MKKQSLFESERMLTHHSQVWCISFPIQLWCENKQNVEEIQPSFNVFTLQNSKPFSVVMGKIFFSDVVNEISTEDNMETNKPPV